MIRAAILTLAALLCASTSAGAQTLVSLGAERPALKSSATVNSDVVRIGDLIDHAGVVAQVPIFRAPDLGTSGTVSAAQIIEAVRAHALIGLNTDGIEEVRVTRASRAIPIQDFEAELAATLSTRYQAGDAKDIAFRFDKMTRIVHVDAKANGEIHTTNIGYDARSGRFDATVEIGGIHTSRLRFTGVALPSVNVVTLNRQVARGEVIKAADVVAERRPRNEASADLLVSAEQVIGRAARSTLTAGRVLRSSDLTKQELVQRNEIVTIIYEVPGITLTMRGKANESGGEGDVVEILNIQSKRSLHGVVTGPGRVVVSGLAANTLASAQLDQSSQSTRAIARAQ